MPTPESTTPTASTPQPPSPAQGTPISQLARVIGQAARFPGDAYGLGTGEKAALARMDPDAMRAHQIAALSRALIQAGLDPESWKPETWRRWGLIAHGMALAGHNGKEALGVQLFKTASGKPPLISESRVNKLLTARGEAFAQLIPPLLRLLASKDVAPNWNELGGLILHQGRDEERAESIRMQIASRYFSELARQTHQ